MVLLEHAVVDEEEAVEVDAADGEEAVEAEESGDDASPIDEVE